MSRHTHKFTRLCTIESVNADNSRETIAENLLCSFPYPADKQAKERGGMGTNERVLQVFIEPRNGIASGQRLTVDSVEYGIHSVTSWTGAYYEVLIKTP